MDGIVTATAAALQEVTDVADSCDHRYQNSGACACKCHQQHAVEYTICGGLNRRRTRMTAANPSCAQGSVRRYACSSDGSRSSNQSRRREVSWTRASASAGTCKSHGTAAQLQAMERGMLRLKC